MLYPQNDKKKISSKTQASIDSFTKPVAIIVAFVAVFYFLIKILFL